ncbi:MAG: fibronectin type III domain-containing protein [Candidatus Omnitrophica bacterium]|nr:fibronectin type III domain-containing protein [Candidatus Omnitrophota bacterium]
MKNFENNFWGNEITAWMNENPFMADRDPEIVDGFDSPSGWFLDYSPHSPSLLVDSPSDLAPAILLECTPNLQNAVNIGLAELTLVFSEGMDTTIQPVVSFDTVFPFTEHIVEPIGWTETSGPSSTWRGTFSVGIETGDGLNTIRVSGAKAGDGFEIPDDTVHHFQIDTSPGTSISNGVATALSQSEMLLEWDPSISNDLFGYTIRRAISIGGPYNLVANLPASVTQTTDTGLNPGATYYYQILEYDSDFNSRQLTSPFLGTTEEAPMPTFSATFTNSPTMPPTPIETPTATFTESATPSLTPSRSYDIGPSQTPDGKVDAHDLLQILEEGKSDSNNWDHLFDFSRFWME